MNVNTVQVTISPSPSSLRRRIREVRVLAKQALGIEPKISIDVDVPLEFHGDGDTGWCIVADSLAPTAVVIDVGIGEDVSFSASIAQKYGCTIHAFDPTPRAIRFLAGLGNERFHLVDRGLAASAGTGQFHLPRNPLHVSGSITPARHLDDEHIDVELVSVQQLFTIVDATRIDLLKLDIEGTEFEVIESDDFATCASSIRQLCVEFHHRWKEHGVAATTRAVSTLTRLGFRCAWYSRTTNEEFLFVRPPVATGVTLPVRNNG